MNVMTTEIFDRDANLTSDASVQKRDAALAKLMKAWESKSARAAKRAGGMSLIAVTLAACNGSSGGSSSNDDNDNGNGEPTPAPDGEIFVVSGFPQTEESSLVFQTTGGGLASAADVVELLSSALEAVAAGNADGAGEDIQTGDIQVIIDSIDDLDGDGSGVVNIGGGGNQTIADQLLTLLNSPLLAGSELLQVNQVEIGRVILTPESASDTIFPEGVTPGNGNDTILMSQTEFLHGAFIDAGDGIDTLEITAKGPYAQPLAVLNVETIDITNQPNLTETTLPATINTTQIINGTVTNASFPLVNQAVLDTFTAANDTWIDLGTVRNIETLRVQESGTGGGDLFVIGVNNSATLQITGSFQNDLIVDYGFSGGDAITVILNNVNFSNDSLTVAQNSTALAIESTGGTGAVENFIHDGNFGPNLRDLTITGDVFLNIDDAVDFNGSRPITIDAGVNTGGVKLTAANNDDGDSIDNNTINLTGSQGDDDFTLTADAFNITSGAGSNTFNLTGSYNGDLVEGMSLIFDGSAGEDEIVLNGGEDAGPFGFDTMLADSSITGVENSLVLNTSYNFTAVEPGNLGGITDVNMSPGVYLAVTAAQVDALGADVFSVIDGAETVSSLESNLFSGQETPVLSIVLESGDDVSLSDLVDVSALDSNVKLGFRIPEDATLTLTAEELHNFVADPGIWMGNDDTNPLQSIGNLVITDAGEQFSIANSGAVDAPGAPFFPGGGTVFTTTGNNNVTIVRSADGFERPSQAFEDDTSIIDSTDGPIVIGPNDTGNSDEEYSIPQADTLKIVGDNDVTFEAPVSFDGQAGFTIDFSNDPDDLDGQFTGTVNGLEIVNFQNITPGPNAINWGEVVGNGGARIDVQLTGDVATEDDGLVSSGVATYVVTDLNEDDRQFWTSEPTQDVETLGLQGNYGNGITFGNVIAGIDFLMEVASDKFDPAYSVGELTVVFARDDVADAVVNVVGLEDLPAGEVQIVEGITLGAVNGNDPASATINVDDGNTVIESLTGEFPVLTVTGGADVTVEGDLPDTLTSTDASGVVGVFTAEIETPDEDFSFLGAEGGTVLTLDDVDGENTIDGGVGGAELVIENTVDLSESTLSNISSVTMTNASTLTLTVEQGLDVGLGNVTVEDAADGNTADLTLNVTEDFDLDLLDLENLPEGLTLQLSIQADATLEITGDQAVALLEAGVTIEDGFDAADGDEPGTVNITGFNQTHLDDVQDDGSIDPFPYGDLFDPAADAATLAGTITTDGSEVFVAPAYGDFFGQFGWELEDGTLGLSNPAMANELVVNNGDVQFFFTNFGGETIGATGNAGIDASDYTDIGTIFVTEFFETVIATGEFNAESIAFLSSDTEIEVVPLAPLEFDGVDRTVVVGGIPFAIDDDGTPFNPATGDPGPVTTGVDLLFNNVSGDDNRNVETVTLAFGEGGNIIGDIQIGGGELPDGNAFETLTLISNGDDVNTVENIFATGNTLTNVAITANEAFDAQTITLSSLEADADGVVTITGTADVTLKAIDTSDANVDTLTVNTTGYTGTLDITGGSPSIIAGEELTFAGTVDSTVLLDTADLTPPDDGNLGIDGNGELTLLDASGMAGTLALGDVDNVADGFTLTGGTGVITANILALPADNWSLDISDAGAGSQIDTTLGSLTSGSLALSTDEDDGTTTLTFGDDTTHVTNELLDLTSFDNVVFGSGVTIELGEDGFVTMDDDTFAAFEAAGGTIIGETAKTFDAGVDLQDVRGLTEINIEDQAAGTVTLSSDQVAIARIVDADDPATDPFLPSDFGDIQALNNEIDLAIVVKEGATFEVTDNEIDEVSISGDGSVVTNIVGIAGADLTLDPASGDNDPGQSITVNFTLDGTPGSVTLDNTATNFTSPAAINAALAGTLGSVAGLNAGVAGGVIEVQADEAGVEFGVTSVDTSDTNGADISFVSNVDSTAEMSGNEVADTTHVFEALTTGGYEVNGTLGGDSSLEIEGENFIDLTGATFPGGPLSINITGTAELKLDAADLDDLIVTGGGSVQADVAGAGTDVDLTGIDVPLQLNVDAGGASADGATLFNPGQPLTLVGAEGVAAPGPVFDITDLDTAGNVPNLNRPSSVDLDNVDFTLTAAQADGLVVTGSSEVTVDMESLGSDNSDLSGIQVDLEITSDADLDFGGILPDDQPIKFSGGNTISLNGSTIPAGAVVSIAAGTTLDVTGGTLGAGVSFIMEDASSTLTITGEQADGTSIEGAADPVTGDPQAIGTVNITGLDGTEDLSGINGPSLALTFADDAVEGSVAASAINGQAISIEGGDETEDFALTITGLEDAPGADLTGLNLNLATLTDTNVAVEVDSTGGVTIGEDANLTITGASSVSLDVTGTGTVDVADGANLSGIGAFTVGQGSTLVTVPEATLTEPNSFIDPANVTGSGTLQYLELDATTTANGDVRTNEFVFDSADTGVTISDFEAEVGNGFFVFDDTDPLNPILGSMRLNLSDFDTTGTGVETIATGATQTDVDGIGVIVVEDGSSPINLDLSAANNGEDAQLFFAYETGGDTVVEYWSDDGTGTGNASDGIVDADELTQVATLTAQDSEDLGSANFTV